jgi:glycosyltransferase involved in cell wall biosynthesis
MRGPTTSGSPGLRLVRDVTVVVPAHDEADGIAACLASVDAAAAAIAPVPVRVVIVLDDCADATADLARAFAPTAAAVAVEVRTVRLRRVGAVRAAGFAGGPRGARSWYATTDADSLVPSSWLRAHLLSAGRHDMFVGTVDVVDWSPRPLGLAAAYAARYQRASSHRHVHATNLGVRASTYWQVGGFIDAGAHEDVALVSAVEAAGGVVDWSSAEPVVTSARRSGRTPTGFSEYLNRLESGRPA